MKGTMRRNVCSNRNNRRHRWVKEFAEGIWKSMFRRKP